MTNSLYEVDLLDKMQDEDYDMFVIKSPVKCKRSSKAFKNAVGGKILIGGILVKIDGIGMRSPLCSIHVGENVIICQSKLTEEGREDDYPTAG